MLLDPCQTLETGFCRTVRAEEIRPERCGSKTEKPAPRQAPADIRPSEKNCGGWVGFAGKKLAAGTRDTGASRLLAGFGSGY